MWIISHLSLSVPAEQKFWLEVCSLLKFLDSLTIFVVPITTILLFSWCNSEHLLGLLVKILFQVECVWLSVAVKEYKAKNRKPKKDRYMMSLEHLVCTCTYQVVELQHKKSSYFSYPNLHGSFLTALDCLFRSLWSCIVFHQLPWWLGARVRFQYAKMAVSSDLCVFR